ncbi:hypothetical protein ACFQT0_19505 [Hymenobacter humi]|uniref:Uncharacterized protein n=1 Tax=Hymenobacter humi TaxID=1411620 RepID=A0ABW2UB35_9BACT
MYCLVQPLPGLKVWSVMMRAVSPGATPVFGALAMVSKSDSSAVST